MDVTTVLTIMLLFYYLNVLLLIEKFIFSNREREMDRPKYQTSKKTQKEVKIINQQKVEE